MQWDAPTAITAFFAVLILIALLILNACAGPRIVADPAFPVMSPAQVEAMERARQAEPKLNEWWVRYTKAWCKAVPGLCQ